MIAGLIKVVAFVLSPVTWSLALVSVRMRASRLYGRAQGALRRDDLVRAIRSSDGIIALSRRARRPLRDDLYLMGAHASLFHCHFRLGDYRKSVEHGLAALAILDQSTHYNWQSLAAVKPRRMLGARASWAEWLARFLTDLRSVVQTHGDSVARRELERIDRIRVALGPQREHSLGREGREDRSASS